MLSPPGEERAAQSADLERLIREEIQRLGGWIGFERFMELALYSPGLGYYSGGMEKFGAAGDFITAPMLGNLFARCLARQCADVLDQAGGGCVYEFGSGDGQLAADMLCELSRLDALPECYRIIETSATLRSRQRETITARTGDLVDRVEWLDRFPVGGFSGVVVANEVLDAMPALCFCVESGGAVGEMGVGDAGGRLHWQPGPRCLPEPLDGRIASLGLSPGYRGEIGRQAEAWVRTVGEQLTGGALLLIDYGFPRGEFYHPDRDAGTLMCHYRHHAHDDPFYYPGLQDITVHVDFTGVWHAARDAGLELSGYTTQAAFLLSLGILDRLAELQDDPRADTRDVLTASQWVKKLLQPHEMGELFKVIALGRGLATPLSGFGLADHRGRLG